MHLEKAVPLFFWLWLFLDFCNLKILTKWDEYPYTHMNARMFKTRQNMKCACTNHPCGRGNSTTSDA